MLRRSPVDWGRRPVSQPPGVRQFTLFTAENDLSSTAWEQRVADA